MDATPPLMSAMAKNRYGIDYSGASFEAERIAKIEDLQEQMEAVDEFFKKFGYYPKLNGKKFNDLGQDVQELKELHRGRHGR